MSCCPNPHAAFYTGQITLQEYRKKLEQYLTALGFLLEVDHDTPKQFVAEVERFEFIVSLCNKENGQDEATAKKNAHEYVKELFKANHIYD